MRFFRSFPVLLASAVLLSAATQASASMIATPVTNAAAQLKEWNLISFNNYTAGNEVGGRVFVGGDYNGVSNEQMNFSGTTSANGTGAITIVGSATGDKIDLTGGDIVVGKNISLGTIEGHNAGSTYAGGTVSAQNIHDTTVTQNISSSANSTAFTNALNNQKTSLVNSMTSLSSNLAALANTGTLNTSYNNSVTFTATQKVNVLSISIDDLNKYAQNGIDITAPDGTTTIINVSGTSGTIDKNFNPNGDNMSNIIWNFYQATSLTLGNWQGTVLAVNAALTKDSQGNLQGTVVANSVANYGEIHSYAFQGDLSSVVSAAPEPATWAMLVLGFGAIGFALRRRRPVATSPMVPAHA